MAGRTVKGQQAGDSAFTLFFRPSLGIKSSPIMLKAPLRKEGRSWEMLGTELQPFIEALLGINGVAGVVVEAYRVSILKAEMYQWAEIKPSITRAVLEQLGINMSEPEPPPNQ